MPSYGRYTTGATTGYQIRAAADPQNARWKPAGITLDWTTVTAVSGSPVTTPDGLTVAVGALYLRFGQLLTKITASGKFGPYDPAAADGRQNLVRGECFILDETVLQFFPLTLSPGTTDNPKVFDGGLVWLDRLLQSGVAANSLAAGPTKVNFETAFPAITYAEQ